MKKIIIAAALAMTLTGMTSCTGLLMSSDFGYDDYGPSVDYYWPNYGNIYNPPLGYYGPAWGTPSPPPQVVVRPTAPPNGANRPNYVPSQPNQGQNNQRPPVTTTPTGQQRPGNMGQGPAQTQPNQNNSGSSGTHRGR